MSIDVSSIIPLPHPAELKIKKATEDRSVKPVKEASGTGYTKLELNMPFTEDIGRNYNSKGNLTKDHLAPADNIIDVKV